MFDVRTFAEALRRSRTERGMTQAALAEALFVTPQSVSRWERGEAVPDIGHLAELSALLGVSLDTLILDRRPGTRAVIGVDAGGTKTEFVLMEVSGTVLNRVVLEKANPNIAGIDAVLRIAKRGVDLLRTEGIQILGLFFGGAGMKTGNYADVLTTELRRHLPGVRIFCDSDSLNVIACASTPEACIAVISGTGSSVFLSHDGRVERFGGAGYLFEGGGSGFDVGRGAIAAALRDQDGVGPKTLLTELVTEKLGAPAWESIRELYRQGVPYVASFAPLVSRAAGEGDGVARDILEQNAAHLVRLIRTAAARAPEVETVIFSGGMIVRDELFRSLVVRDLPARLRPEVLTRPPVFGACLNCARLLGLEAPNGDLFDKSMKTE